MITKKILEDLYDDGKLRFFNDKDLWESFCDLSPTTKEKITKCGLRGVRFNLDLSDSCNYFIYRKTYTDPRVIKMFSMEECAKLFAVNCLFDILEEWRTSEQQDLSNKYSLFAHGVERILRKQNKKGGIDSTSDLSKIDFDFDINNLGLDN